jgi:heme oxygenase
VEASSRVAGEVREIDVLFTSLPGIYYLSESLKTAIVVIHQLPRTQETLWLRRLGRGTVQKQAIDELAALPLSQPYVKITLELLDNLQQNLRINQSSETEDRELIMRLAPLYQQKRELDIQTGEQKLIIRQLNRRFGEIDSLLIDKVRALSVERLEELGDALLDFTSIDDLETWFKFRN